MADIVQAKVTRPRRRRRRSAAAIARARRVRFAKRALHDRMNALLALAGTRIEEARTALDEFLQKSNADHSLQVKQGSDARGPMPSTWSHPRRFSRRIDLLESTSHSWSANHG